MKVLKITALSTIIALTGCAELVSINNAIGEYAGKVNQAIGVEKDIVKDDSLTSRKSVDSAYLIVKRNFKFQTKEEYIRSSFGTGAGDLDRKMATRSYNQNGNMLEAQPGVFYTMQKGFENPRNKNKGMYLKVDIEKNGKGSKIYWTTTGPKGYAEFVKKEMLKILK